MLESLYFQVYTKWQLCIVDDCSKQDDLTECILAFKKKYPQKVFYKKNATNLHISQSSNVCLQMAQGDYITFLDHDDRLYPHSLFEMVRWICRYNRPKILYSDERLIDEKGYWIGEPYLKPSYSEQLLLEYNYITHMVFYKKELVDELNGFREGYDGAQDHDLL